MRHNKELGAIAKTGHIIRTLLKDGLMYYSVIFCINFVLAVMIMTATVSSVFHVYVLSADRHIIEIGAAEEHNCTVRSHS